MTTIGLGRRWPRVSPPPGEARWPVRTARPIGTERVTGYGCGPAGCLVPTECEAPVYDRALGDALRECRVEMGLSLREAAALLEVRPRWLEDLEAGRTVPESVHTWTWIGWELALGVDKASATAADSRCDCPAMPEGPGPCVACDHTHFGGSGRCIEPVDVTVATRTAADAGCSVGRCTSDVAPHRCAWWQPVPRRACGVPLCAAHAKVGPEPADGSEPSRYCPRHAAVLGLGR